MQKTIATPYTVRTAARADFTATEVVIFLLFLVVAVSLLSVFVFSTQSLRLDEAQSLWQTSHSPLAMFQIVAEDVHVPLYHLMLHYWQIFLGNSVVLARMLSLLFFLLMIPAIYVLGSRTYSTSIGLYSALLAAISPFLNWYGNEIRMYSLFALFTIVNQYFFTRLFMEQERADGTIRSSIWVWYAVTLYLGMFTHYFFAFNAAAQAIFYFLYRKQFPKHSLRNFIIIGLVALLMIAPWAYFVYTLGAASNTQPLLAQPTSIDVFNTFSQFLFGFQNDHMNTILISLWPLLVLLVFLSLRRNQTIAPQTVYFFLSLLVPVILAFAISEGVKPIYLTRYLILTLPSLYVLVSWILSSYPQRLARVLKVALVIAMVVTLTMEIVNANTPVKEDYRAASTYLNTKAQPQDIIVLSAPFTVYPFEYYYQGPSEVETLPIWDRYTAGPIPQFSQQELAADVNTLKDSHQILWLLLSYDQGYEENIRMYFDTHFQRIDAQNFSPGLDLYGYKLRYDNEDLAHVLKAINEQTALDTSGKKLSVPPTNFSTVPVSTSSDEILPPVGSAFMTSEATPTPSPVFAYSPQPSPLESPQPSPEASPTYTPLYQVIFTPEASAAPSPAASRVPVIQPSPSSQSSASGVSHASQNSTSTATSTTTDNLNSASTLNSVIILNSTSTSGDSSSSRPKKKGNN